MDIILTPTEIAELANRDGDLTSSAQARVHTMLEERLRRDITHAEFERVLANTILDQTRAIANCIAREDAVKAACNFDISGDASPETTIRRLYHDNIQLSRDNAEMLKLRSQDKINPAN